MVDNLVSNAVRHISPGGTIWLRCHLVDSQTVEIDVEDSGPGIDPQDLPFIFERFYKSGDSRGMGLGLSIAHGIVKELGGAIGFATGSGGTTFRVELPLP